MVELPLPRRLVLLRHAKSSWDTDAARDFDRPLAERGEAAAPDVGRFLVERDLAPEWVLCSPAVRTCATWALVRAGLDVPPVEVFDPALYLASARTLLLRIHETPARVSSLVVIGHNPGLRDLAAELAAAADPAVGAAIAAHFPTAALLAIDVDGPDWSVVGSHAGRILAWRTPKGREPHEF